jgi:hypothetical protein
MRSLFLSALTAILFLVSPRLTFAQALPTDFKLSITSGGAAPWSEKTRVTIDNAGQANYVRYTSGNPPAILAESTFTVAPADLQNLWQTVQDSSFSSLPSDLSDSTARDGMMAKLAITANGTSHQVTIRNVAQPAVQAIIGLLNTIIPPSLQLPYTPPEKFNVVPIDPCNSLGRMPGLRPSGDSRFRSSLDPKIRAWADRVARPASVADEPPHPGSMVAYALALRDALLRNIATLTSKGEFFGDAVSISVDNRNVPPANTVSMTFYMEYWGPLATPGNINAIELDIAKKWGGLKTTSGKDIEVGFVDRTNTTTTAPPGTPGFHEIHLVPHGAVRSVVNGGPTVNQGVGDCTWALGEDPGTYGHEAGHLLGLPDRYVDFNKQPNGSWVNAKTGQSYANDDAFASYYASKYPPITADAAKNFLSKVDLAGMPQDGAENDLMAVVKKAPTQADIDQIASAPGLEVNVPEGTILSNRSGGEQNLVVTRAEQVYAPPGGTRVLNGIYAACIDHNKESPSRMGVFDVTPPLKDWTGILAASYLAKLMHFVDSTRLYCGYDLTTQEAIWRLSDNEVSGYPTDVDSLLIMAGVNIGNEMLDFPRLGGGTWTDTSSHLFIPTALFVADISPAFASAQVGIPTAFSGHFARPPEVKSPVSVSWTVSGPTGQTAALAGTDSTASLTPARSGVYQLALTFSYDDSALGHRTFSSDRKAYAIVPDANTETFEHNTITDAFPWTTSGDVPWTISHTTSQTGNASASPVGLGPGQTSTLAIKVSLPTDSVLVFSVRTASANAFDALVLAVDSVNASYFSGLADWSVQKVNLRAGNHVLTWTAKGAFAGVLNAVWVDNVFFPGATAMTSVAAAAPAVPRTFVLNQNFPNPFNPSTSIRYALPHRSYVTLTVFNTLGQQVAQLVDGEIDAGYHEIQFNANNLASGVYFYRMQAGSFVETKSLCILK